MKGYVYILESIKDGNGYIGSTINVNRRFKEHNRGFVRSTKSRVPFKLKHVLEFASIQEAARMEKKFKASHDSLKRELKIRGVV
jgi:putative endonuclease